MNDSEEELEEESGDNAKASKSPRRKKSVSNAEVPKLKREEEVDAGRF